MAKKRLLRLTGQGRFLRHKSQKAKAGAGCGGMLLLLPFLLCMGLCSGAGNNSQKTNSGYSPPPVNYTYTIVAEPKKPEPAEPQKPEPSKRVERKKPEPVKRVERSSPVERYWINTSTGVRHNSGCRWYKNTKRGGSCGATDGTACGLCGG